MPDDLFGNLRADDTMKGIPAGTPEFPVQEAGRFGWNVLAEDMTFPLAVLKDSAIRHNSAWMSRFLKATRVHLAPHGKTTMSPQLFHRQLCDGAWGITLATIQQLQVARRFGIGRIVLANQLIGRQAIRFVLDEVERDPAFDFYCVADSITGVEILGRAARERGLARPLQILVEGGVRGARTGCRDLDGALAVARAVAAQAPRLALRGVEAFEGVISDPDRTVEALRVEDFLRFLCDIATACAAEDLFAPGPVLLSAGGSAFYDIVARVFGALDLGCETQVVLRSGCYLTHDSIMYEAFARAMQDRSELVQQLGDHLRPALEVWAQLQSRPEPERAIAILGKRDASYDAGLPKPVAWFRPGFHQRPELMGRGHASVAINDQHLFIDLPADSPLAVGDLLCFGISHPCLTFDKWAAIPLVDDDYNVTSMIRTFF